MLTVVAALVICAAPNELIDSVDLWEINHYYCVKTGKVIFTQHIWWRVETHDEETDLFVAAWRMSNVIAVIPNREGELYIGRFYDPKCRVFRLIRAKQFIETHTTVDYEAVDRSRLANAQRSGLRR